MDRLGRRRSQPRLQRRVGRAPARGLHDVQPHLQRRGQHADHHAGGYGLLNARFSYTFANDALTFSAFGTNLTNTLYLLSGNASSGFGLAEGAYGRPREWGISAGYKF
jgi:outer membrane receptor protein involved in Fe transport